MSGATFRRIRADEVLPGMRVARARSHSFRDVTATVLEESAKVGGIAHAVPSTILEVVRALDRLNGGSE